MMENNSFEKDLAASTVMEKKFNRKDLRRMYGGAGSNKRSKSPRNIASRKVLPMPLGWEGWRNWEPAVKKVN